MGPPPLKIKILKIGLRSDLNWPKVDLEPKFHDTGTLGGFGSFDSCFISIDITLANCFQPTGHSFSPRNVYNILGDGTFYH